MNTSGVLEAKVKGTQSCQAVCDPHGLCSPWNSPGQNTGVGSLFLLQRIFPTQGLNQGLLHCRWVLYQLNDQGSLEAKASPSRLYINTQHRKPLQVARGVK